VGCSGLVGLFPSGEWRASHEQGLERGRRPGIMEIENV
jgi:hypothetical protein